MFGSIKIAAVRGIPVRLHVSLLIAFLLLLIQLGWLGLPAGVLLFGSVLAHELGHAVVAQRYGIAIAGIDLHLLGGTALMRSMPSSPKQELNTALAGPLVSLLLGVLFIALTALFGVGLDLGHFGLLQLLPYLGGVNIAMAIFNLIPALPMDGGRVLRALLSMQMPALRATRVAARVSRVIAVLFIVGGMAYGAFTLPLIGLVIFHLSKLEERAAEAREAELRSASWFDWPRAPRGPIVVSSRSL